MREIKFRAWSGSRHKMTIPANICNPALTEINGDVLMQYTGLKDKQGKEIYEGDIVKGFRLDYFQSFDEEQYAVVEYIDGGYYPFADNNDYAPYPEPKNVEVIGNIYESSQLLKQVDQ